MSLTRAAPFTEYITHPYRPILSNPIIQQNVTTQAPPRTAESFCTSNSIIKRNTTSNKPSNTSAHPKLVRSRPSLGIPKRTQTQFSVHCFKTTKRKRSSSSISKQELLSVLRHTQQHASLLLGCSVSTVKRRFYELKEEIGISHWPKDYYEELMNHRSFSFIYPLSLKFILN